MSDDAKNPPSSAVTAGSDSTAGTAQPQSQSVSSSDLAAAREKLKEAQDRAAHGGAAGTTTAGTATTGTATTGKAQWTPELATRMAGGIFLFSVLLFAMISVLVWKNKSVDSLLRTYGILLIIVASVFLVIVGYSDQQIAPVMGLMGTIAGYLLSRRTEPVPDAGAPANPNPPATPTPPAGPNPTAPDANTFAGPNPTAPAPDKSGPVPPTP